MSNKQLPKQPYPIIISLAYAPKTQAAPLRHHDAAFSDWCKEQGLPDPNPNHLHEA